MCWLELALVTGLWLEGLIHLRILERIAETGRSDAEVATGLEIAAPGAEHDAALTDFDNCLLVGETFSIIQAKAVTGLSKLNAAVQQVAGWRTRVSLQVGKAYIVAPMLRYSEMQKIGAQEDARRLGVELCCDTGAVETMLDSLLPRRG